VLVVQCSHREPETLALLSAQVFSLEQKKKLAEPSLKRSRSWITINNAEKALVPRFQSISLSLFFFRVYRGGRVEFVEERNEKRLQRTRSRFLLYFGCCNPAGRIDSAAAINVFLLGSCLCWALRFTISLAYIAYTRLLGLPVDDFRMDFFVTFIMKKIRQFFSFSPLNWVVAMVVIWFQELS
jgi:hypothetical protein